MSVRVSQFENLVKPIADPAAGAFIRTSINGYFCDITNLSVDAEVQFLSVISKWTPPGAPSENAQDREFTTTAPGPQQDQSGTGNHTVIFDIAGGSAQGQNFVGEFRYLGETNCVKVYASPRLRLCRGGTGQLAVLPFLGGGPFGPNLLGNQKFEVRGYLAAAVVRTARPVRSVKLMFQPQQRGTFLPTGLTNDPAEVSQLFSSLTTASGRSEENVSMLTSQSLTVAQWANANNISPSDPTVAAFDDQLRLIV